MPRKVWMAGLVCVLSTGAAWACGQSTAQTMKPDAQQAAQSQSGAQAGQSQTEKTQNGQAGTQQSSTAATPSSQATPPPAARTADVASVDAIMAATYDVISGPAGQKRDWNRFLSLFVPGARLVAATKKQDGSPFLFNVTPAEYASRADAYFEKSGFFEKESARHTDRYGDIIQIFSTYESRHDAKDAEPFARGINSFQLYFDGTRWWVVNIFWQEETPENPIPKEYLPPGR